MNDENTLSRLRKQLLIGGPSVIVITILVLVVFGDAAPFSVMVPILTILWIIGFWLTIKYLTLTIKGGFKRK